MTILLFHGEDDLYNVNFIENFDNDQNSYQYDTYNSFAVPDRSANGNSNPFSSSEKSYVDSFTGCLKFSSTKEENISTIQDANIESISFDSNFSNQFISSDTGIRNLLSGNSNNSWNITVKSPSIINESIFSQDKYSLYKNSSSNDPGIEVAVKVVLRNSVNASRIRISPNIGYGLYATQLLLQKAQSNTQNSQSTENNYIPILTDSIYSEKNIDIDFPPEDIKSFIIFFKQRKYKRIKITPQQSEINSKLINYLAKNIRLERKKKHDVLQDYVIDFFLKDYSRNFVLKNKEIYSYNYSKYYPISRQGKQVQILRTKDKQTTPSDVDAFNRFKNADAISNMVFSIVAFSIGSKMRSMNPTVYIESNLRSVIRGIESYSSGGIVPLGDSNNSEPNAHFVNEINSPFTKNDALQSMNNMQEANVYEYMLSIKNIALMTVTNIAEANISKRSQYTSKRLPLGSRPMSVKCLLEKKVTSIRSSSIFSDPTSIELSVSVKDSPEAEGDWKPILPSDAVEVSSELLMFNNTNKQASFRFAPLQESVVIYKNGEPMSSTLFQVTGTFVTIGTLDSSAVYVAKYTPLNLATSKEIQLYSGSLASPALVSSSTMGQSGEYFSSINYDMSVQLSENPYIDRVKFSNAQYNIYTGTTTSSNTDFGNFDYSNYSPVKIIFDDGTTAINITNYLLDDNQVPSFTDSTNAFYFIHYDKTIIFNKKPTQKFRVLYHYIQDSFRYRVIFRSLNSTSENYSLDRIIFKFSCEKENVIENKFIRYDNIFKPRLV
jgi:hypothetical protein